MKETFYQVFFEASLNNIGDNIFNSIPVANKYKFYVFIFLIFRSKPKS